MIGKSLKILLYVIVVLSFTFSAQAQHTINGRITAFNKFPLKNVTVASKKSKQTVVSDSLGLYKIDVSSKDKIQIKVDGFYPVVFKTDNEDTLNVNLIYIDNKRSFESVVENGIMNEQDLTEALDKYIDQNNNFHTFNNIFEVIQSVYPSVVIDDTQSPVKLYLPGRGATDSAEGHEALLVVNHIMSYDISDISPTQVRKVKVLTGTDATMIYGNRGSNGVIQIELKD